MQVAKLVVHHSASERSKTTFKDIEQWHKKRGFAQIGYHQVIEGDGVIKNGRPESMAGAHAKGANHDSLGVCVIGDFEKEMPNTPQMDALIKLLSRWCVENNLDPSKIYGHFEVPGGTTPTLCPGNKMKLQLHSIRTKVKARIEKMIHNYI